MEEYHPSEYLEKNRSKHLPEHRSRTWQRFRIESLFGHLTRNLIGSNGILRHLDGRDRLQNRRRASRSYRSFEAEIGADENKWGGNTEPKSKQSQECGEWNGCRTPISPKNQIQHEENAENQAEITRKRENGSHRSVLILPRTGHGRHQDILLPFFSAEH